MKINTWGVKMPYKQRCRSLVTRSVENSMVSNNKCCQDLTERIFIGNHMGEQNIIFSSLHIQLQVQQGWLLPPLPGSARVVGSFFPLGDYCWWLLDHRSICRAACFLSSLFTKCLSLVFIHREEGSHWINHPDLQNKV